MPATSSPAASDETVGANEAAWRAAGEERAAKAAREDGGKVQYRSLKSALVRRRGRPAFCSSGRQPAMRRRTGSGATARVRRRYGLVLSAVEIERSKAGQSGGGSSARIMAATATSHYTVLYSVPLQAALDCSSSDHHHKCLQGRHNLWLPADRDVARPRLPVAVIPRRSSPFHSSLGCC